MIETLLDVFMALSAAKALKRRPYALLLIVLLPGISIIFLGMIYPYCSEGSELLYTMCVMLEFGSVLFILPMAIITAIAAIVAGWVRGRVRIIIGLVLTVYVASFLYLFLH